MKRITKTAGRSMLVLLAFLNNSTAAWSEDLLFGKPYTPYSKERNEQAWADFRKAKLKWERTKFGTKNGLLAEDLQQQMLLIVQDPFAPERPAALTEWLEVYPKIPSGSQLYLAAGALTTASAIRRLVHSKPSRGFCGPGYNQERDREKTPEEKARAIKIADDITRCVITAAAANNWYLTPSLKDQLKAVSYQNVDTAVCEQARSILEKKPRQVDVDFEKLLLETTARTKELMEDAPEETKILPKRPEYSWWPAFIASMKNPDGTMKEQVGVESNDMVLKIIPVEDAAKLKISIYKLQEQFTKLPLESKERVTATILNFTREAFYTNLQPAIEPLLWRVISDIDPSWLEENAIESAIPNVYYYGDSYKAEKLYRKQMEIQDIHYGGLGRDSALRYALGDLFDRRGNKSEAKKMWEQARQIDERFVRTGILERSDYTERNYNIRAGIYKSPNKAAEIKQ